MADLVLTGGNLITLDPARPRAPAMAVRDDLIIAVGDDHQVLRLAAPAARRVHLAGKTVTPGFIDAHVHPIDFGTQLMKQADLTGSASMDEILSRLSELSRRVPEGWLLGYGFDQEKVRERRFPSRDDLDRVSRDRPILIWRICGHVAVVNAATLSLMNAQERAAGDEPSGLYAEHAAWAIHQKIPPLSDPEMEQALLMAARVALRTGITSMHAIVDDLAHMAAFMRLRRKDLLPIRATVIPPFAAMETLHRQGMQSNAGDEWLRLGALKLFADGSLGAQTALLSEPYADKPQTCGLRFHQPENLKAQCAQAHANGFQLAIHAIGDQAVRETIAAIEFALGDENNSSYRHRIEHASIITPECISRMAQRGVVATLQPQFVTSDTWTPRRIGPHRLARAYPFRSMIEAGVPVALGSDCPVEKLDAFACLAAAVGRAEWSPLQTLSAEQAISAYCLGGAYAAFAEDHVGSLQPRKLADFVVLSADPTSLDADAIRNLKAERVFVGGKEVDQSALQPGP